MLEKIKHLCKANGISIAELERIAGIPSKSIFGWEDHMPAADRLCKVAKILGTTVEDLIYDKTTET